MLVTSIFSFSNNVFKNFLHAGLKNQRLFAGKGLDLVQMMEFVFDGIVTSYGMHFSVCHG